MAGEKEIRVPDLGDFSDVDVIEVLVSPGDSVEAEDGLIVLETDKASMDVPSPEAGTVRELRVSVGDTVNEGDVIAILEVSEPAGESAGEDAEQPDDSGEDAQERHDAPAAESAAAQPEDKPTGSRGAEDTEAQPASRKVTVPDLGDFDEVDVIEVHVAEGDDVAVEDPLITLETDKATMDVPAPAAGRVTAVSVGTGDKVSSGDEILTLSSGDASRQDSEPKDTGEDKGPSAPESSEEAPQSISAAESAGPADGSAERRGATDAEERTGMPSGFPGIDEAGFSRAHASPSVRKLARELGVDLTRIEGSGNKGRILADDVKAWVKKTLSGDDGGQPAGAGLPALPEVDFGKFGEIELEPFGRVRRIAAKRLHAAWVNLPHVTQHDLADITDLEERRQALKGPAAEKGIRLTPLAFIIKACVQALREFPRFNSSLHPDGEHLVMKHYCHIGFAADTTNGLVVPVIRDADRKDVYELATELAELSEAARDGKLSAEQMQGGTFTVSSLGGIGGTAFTPIINPPEVAILGVSRSGMKPVWNGREFQPRLMLPLSLSYDHRVIDGADAARFTTWLSGALGEVSSLLEAIP